MKDYSVTLTCLILIFFTQFAQAAKYTCTELKETYFGKLKLGSYERPSADVTKTGMSYDEVYARYVKYKETELKGMDEAHSRSEREAKAQSLRGRFDFLRELNDKLRRDEWNADSVAHLLAKSNANIQNPSTRKLVQLTRQRYEDFLEKLSNSRKTYNDELSELQDELRKEGYDLVCDGRVRYNCTLLSRRKNQPKDDKYMIAPEFNCLNHLSEEYGSLKGRKMNLIFFTLSDARRAQIEKRSAEIKSLLEGLQKKPEIAQYQNYSSMLSEIMDDRGSKKYTDLKSELDRQEEVINQKYPQYKKYLNELSLSQAQMNSQFCALVDDGKIVKVSSHLNDFTDRDPTKLAACEESERGASPETSETGQPVRRQN